MRAHVSLYTDFISYTAALYLLDVGLESQDFIFRFKFVHFLFNENNYWFNQNSNKNLLCTAGSRLNNWN